MYIIGIDIGKNHHEASIVSPEGKQIDVYKRQVQSVSDDLTKVKVGLEATGHYSYNLLGFLLDKGLPTYVINPLHTNLYRKSLSLRKTKTDKVDALSLIHILQKQSVL